jgi:polyisoprenoid-binding protein YceI
VFLALSLLALVSPTRALDQSPTRALDQSPGTIRFTGYSIFGAARGEFRSWKITHAVIDDRHPERSKVSLEIDMASLETRSWMRDMHLKSAHFFDVENYPTASVTLDQVELKDPRHFIAHVEIDVHGQSKTFPMWFKIADRSTRRITGEVTLRRSDFAVGPSSGGPMFLDDNVLIAVDAVVPPAGKIP